MHPKEKWNKKYSDKLKDNREPVPNERLKNLSAYLNGATALDVACGLGGNSLFLAGLGYEVVALDLSDTAVNFLTETSLQKNLKIKACVVDLIDHKNLNLKPLSFDLVVMTYYLDRTIFPYVRDCILLNGYFFMETYYASSKNPNHRISDHYKLLSQELLQEFKDWKIIYFEENEQEGRQTIFCQKI